MDENRTAEALDDALTVTQESSDREEASRQQAEAQ